MKGIKYLVAAVAAWAVHGVAMAQIPTIDAASIAKLIMQIEETQRVLQQATATTNSLSNPLGANLTANQLSELQALLNAARAANAAGGVLDASSANAAMQQLQQLYQVNPATGRADYDTYMNATKNTIRGSMSNNAAVLQQIQSDASRLDGLVSQSNSAAGALQAQQAGTQVTAELAAQVQKLRQQQAMQAQAESAAALAEAERKQQKEADRRATTSMFLFTRPDPK